MNELYHYGIKGQKWGVRRYQNNDGSLTLEGKRHYDRDSNDKKMSTGTKIAIGVGATTLVATGAYFAHKYYQMNADAVIKKGKDFQHMGRAVEDLSKPFYASHLKGDNKIYAKNDFFGSHWKTQKTLVSNKDIKIAGTKVTLNTFSEWVNTSKIGNEYFKNLDTNNRKDVKYAYYVFNKNLTSPDQHDKEVFSDFYRTLATKGYDAIRDMNDQKNSGIRSPIIIFNSLSDIMTVKVKDL